MLIRTPKVSSVLDNLRNYGRTIIHTVVSNTQDDKLNAMLQRARAKVPGATFRSGRLEAVDGV